MNENLTIETELFEHREVKPHFIDFQGKVTPELATAKNRPMLINAVQRPILSV